MITLAALVVAVTLLVVLAREPFKGPPLATSCRNPAIAVGHVAGTRAGTLRYALTGPTGGTYIVAIDATTARAHGDGVDVTPQTAVAVALRRGLPDCRAQGALPALTAGSHQVVLFRDGTVVASAVLP